MSVFDTAALLREISPDAPSGPDLEYDPEFGQLNDAMTRKPEQQMGDSFIPAEDPNWREAKRISLELFKRTRDIRVAVSLTESSLHLDGFPGFCAGIELIEGLLTGFWDTVHPELDAEDDNDPTMRVNATAGLVADEFIQGVRKTPLVSSRALGQFSLRDVQVAAGDIQATDPADVPDAATVDGAFLDCDADELKTTAEAVSVALEKSRAIEAYLNEQVGAANSVDLAPLVLELRNAGLILTRKLEVRGIGAPEAEAAGEAGEEGGAAAAAGAPAAPPQALSGAINTREDVIRAIDKIRDYFQKNEPASPIPLLLNWAKRLVPKSFIEIMEDLGPDGLAQLQTVGGSSQDSE